LCHCRSEFSDLVVFGGKPATKCGDDAGFAAGRAEVDGGGLSAVLVDDRHEFAMFVHGLALAAMKRGDGRRFLRVVEPGGRRLNHPKKGGASNSGRFSLARRVSAIYFFDCAHSGIFLSTACQTDVINAATRLRER
jgi:hypothetical protein